MTPIRGNNEDRRREEQLDALLRAFAQSAIPEPSANFMPTLWQKIEARQTFTFSFRRMANAFAAAAVALTLALTVYMYVPRSSAQIPSQTYLDVLADSHPLVAPELVSPARLEYESGK